MLYFLQKANSLTSKCSFCDLKWSVYFLTKSLHVYHKFKNAFFHINLYMSVI